MNKPKYFLLRGFYDSDSDTHFRAGQLGLYSYQLFVPDGQTTAFNQRCALLEGNELLQELLWNSDEGEVSHDAVELAVKQIEASGEAPDDLIELDEFDDRSRWDREEYYQARHLGFFYWLKDEVPEDDWACDGTTYRLRFAKTNEEGELYVPEYIERFWELLEGDSHYPAFCDDELYWQLQEVGTLLSIDSMLSGEFGENTQEVDADIHGIESDLEKAGYDGSCSISDTVNEEAIAFYSWTHDVGLASGWDSGYDAIYYCEKQIKEAFQEWRLAEDPLPKATIIWRLDEAQASARVLDENGQLVKRLEVHVWGADDEKLARFKRFTLPFWEKRVGFYADTVQTIEDKQMELF